MISDAQILGAHILIVDDQAASVILLERMLGAAGYTHVSVTSDPRAVCELHRAHHYDLILLDLMMPVMDGFEVMEGLKPLEVDGYLSVLAITASSGHRLRALQCGARDFVSKPFDLPEVLTRVHNMLEVRLMHVASQALVKQLEQLALQDPLTGLANRRMASERMGIALAHGRMNHSAMAVLYLDLDGFKAVNDTFGHAVGDLLLKGVSQRMVATVRAEDTVARLGGDEFMLALWHVVDEADAKLVAAKVIAAVSQPYELEGQVVKVTASIGIALFPGVGEDAESLMKGADQALYQAKKSGKNAVRVYRRSTD